MKSSTTCLKKRAFSHTNPGPCCSASLPRPSKVCPPECHHPGQHHFEPSRGIMALRWLPMNPPCQASRLTLHPVRPSCYGWTEAAARFLGLPGQRGHRSDKAQIEWKKHCSNLNQDSPLLAHRLRQVYSPFSSVFPLLTPLTIAIWKAWQGLSDTRIYKV